LFPTIAFNQFDVLSIERIKSPNYTIRQTHLDSELRNKRATNQLPNRLTLFRNPNFCCFEFKQKLGPSNYILDECIIRVFFFASHYAQIGLSVKIPATSQGINVECIISSMDVQKLVIFV